MAKKARKTFAFYLDNDTNNGALVICEENNVTLGELANGYVDNSEDVEGGVWAWADENGRPKLEVRPKFQRAFVVDGNINWQSALVHSVINKRPIGVIYFGKKADGTYMNIDGQQRLMTLLSFINGKLTLKMLVGNKVEKVTFEMLDESLQRRIKNYTPAIKICIGDESALLSWFETINQPTSQLTEQELRNAAYNGKFVESAKKYFSLVKKTAKPKSFARDFLGEKEDSIYSYKRYSTGLEPWRQDVLEMALDWVSYRDFRYDEDGDELTRDERIEAYMLAHREDENADDVATYWMEVINWVNDIFLHNYTPENPSAYQSLASQDWHKMYIKYKDYTDTLDEAKKIEITEHCKMYVGMGADLYQKSTGIYEWVLRGEKREEENTYLHIRLFDKKDRQRMFNAQGGIDPTDGKKYSFEEMEGHHIIPWEEGGPTEYNNLVMLSKKNHDRIHLGVTEFTPDRLRAIRDELRRKIAV